MGINGYQRTPWSEELDGNELHEALGGECDMEPRGSAFCMYTESTQPFWASTKQLWYYPVFKRAVFQLIACTAVLLYRSTSHSLVSFLADYAFVHANPKEFCVS